MECLSYCVANGIDLARLDPYLKSFSDRYQPVRSRDVIKLHFIDAPHQIVFIFKNGTIVFWGMKRYLTKTLLDEIKPFTDKPIPQLVHDEVSYQFSDNISIRPHDYFDVDCLTIDAQGDCEELRLSLSYGFSQSVKLQYFESLIDSLAERYTPLIEKASIVGKMPISTKRLRQATGEILGTKTDLNVISNFLYHPKYFWQHPTLEEHYTMLERYLHVQRRVSAINHRLDTINEIFDMFNQYLTNRHAHTLEIIIIALIAIEIVFGVLNFHF